jgi:MtN3 and saliva related transmembrane protein
MITELIGWSAAVILLLTIGRQVYTQWRDRTSAGISHWLFIGQVAASIGFVAYSWLEGDPVFVATNAAMLVTAVIGQVIYLRNRNQAPGNGEESVKNPYSARG